MERTRFWIHTFGCRSNQYDGEWIRRTLISLGFDEAEKPELARYLILNTCVVTHKAERDAKRYLNNLNKLQDKYVIVTGCIVPLGLNLNCDFSGNPREVVEFIKDKEGIKDYVFFIPRVRQKKARAILRIQDGCSFSCSFCIVPLVRGPQRSRDFNEVIKEAETLIDLGYKEIVITGTQVGGWGRDLGYSLTKLFETILKLGADVHIRLSSILPHYLTDELLYFYKENKRMLKHFHIPLQSGSPKILRLMKRPYTLEVFENRIYKIRELFPEAGIGTDMIAGFPNEEEEDHLLSIRALEEFPFTYAHIFEFSPRKPTDAYYMEKKIDPQTRKRRVRELIEVARRKKREFALKFLNREVPAMVERKKEDSFLGTTENYLKVLIKKENGLEIGDYVSLRVEEVTEESILIGKVS